MGGECAAVARRAKESPWGTAATCTGILAIECRGVWERSAIDSPGVATFREALKRLLSARPGTRLQLIRQPARRSEARRMYYANFSSRRVVCGTWERGADSLRWDRLEAEDEVDGPIALVCVHGKRDRCCAKWGTEYYQALASSRDCAAEHVWMTTHVGGHRFAPTFIELASGLCYGMLTPEETKLEALPLERVRGRMLYPDWLQVAELGLASEYGGLGEWQPVLSAHADAELAAAHNSGHIRQARFVRGEASVLVSVTQEVSEARRLSCGDKAKAMKRWSFGSAVLEAPP